MAATVTGDAAEASVLTALHGVPWLSALGPEALAHVARLVEPVQFPEGRTILAELEAGDDLFVLVSGKAKVAVIAAGGRRKEIGALGPGDACGEISVLTRDLRSATVTAATPVKALRLERADFEHLLACYPSIAVHFARVLSARLADSDEALDAATGAGEWKDDLTSSRAGLDRIDQLALEASSQSALKRAWRELVVTRKRELPFLALSSFVAVLFLVRTIISLLPLHGDLLFNVLRVSYTSGIAMVFVSTAAALARFRARTQRVLALVFGAGFALILNQLSVFLAFDTFYLDMTTRDPNMAFDVEALYRRSESEWAVALMLGGLLLTTYLRHFLRRSLFVLTLRLRGKKA